MRRSPNAISPLPARSLVSVCAVFLALLAALVLIAPSAHALPPASGSKCSSNWVNNAAAMQCFTQGEEDIHHGVAHPHYVACTAAGEVFCCVNDNNGNQDCEVQASKAKTTEAQRIRAILAAHRAMVKSVELPPGNSDSKASGPTRKSAP